MTPPNQSFRGAEKVGKPLLHGPETRLKMALLPLVPSWLGTHHLTLLTILWSGLVVFFFYLARGGSLNWVHGVSVMIAAQYVTDLLDGAIGRQRDTGLVRWGFYMDHFLDWVFLYSIIVGYYLISPSRLDVHYLLLSGLLTGFMINSFLAFGATNEFEIYFFGIGPTEFRLLLILINTLVVEIGMKYAFFTVTAINILLALVLCALVFTTQKKLWKIDMDAKRQGGPS